MRNEIQAVEKKMVAALDALKHQLGTLRTGRASAALLEGVMVSSYGTETPLKQVCNLTVPESSLIVAQPWDPSLCGEIDKAIRKADLGLNPVSDGKVVRIPVPPPTEERRKEIVKKGHHMAEEVRVEVRRFRHEVQTGMIGVNIGVAAPVAFFPFSGWKDSFLGDLHAHGPDAVDFYTRKKTVTSRWFSSGQGSGTYFVER